MAKSFGDAFVIDLETRAIRCLTCNVPGAAFLRVMHLPSSDYLLIGPERFEDLGRSRSRDNELWFLSRKPGSRPVKLGRRMSEGAAVSKRSTKIAFSVGHAQDPAVPEGQTRLVVADLDRLGRDARAARRARRLHERRAGLHPRGPGLLRRRPQAHLQLLRAGGPRERLDDRPRDRRARRTSRPRSASTTRSRASSPTAGTPASRATTSRARSATRPASATSTSGSSASTAPAATSPASPPSTTTRAGRPRTPSSRPTGASWPSRWRAPPTRPASATASCCSASTGRRPAAAEAAQRIAYQRAVVIARTRPSQRR